ncbi:hypothetical protein DAPPUDRAFT_120545 [Daphnia pulex]|uniref:Uncharacterized protein n=1 Tax=Daphnia pulex TaxID=6669 RepID=E9I1P7_DAPPU|nr:hypothetical protein DAPPUDRAFT_120545 [Daphnia pulex]|eukprot:EFX62083.1 hypothetical protein DAPPUDRAFT_120545 [Daphnia pulex]
MATTSAYVTAVTSTPATHVTARDSHWNAIHRKRRRGTLTRRSAQNTGPAQPARWSSSTKALVQLNQEDDPAGSLSSSISSLYNLLSRKVRIGRVTLPAGVTVYLTKLQKTKSAPHTPVEPDLLAEATGGIPPIPRVTEEIKWRPTVETETNTSIFDNVDEFIRLPVDDIIKRLQEERITGSPDLKNRAKLLDQLWREDLSPEFDWNTYSGELNEATGFRGWDSDDDTLSTFDLDLIFPSEEMALTQAAIDQLRDAANDNTDALVSGMRNLAAQRKIENIPGTLVENVGPVGVNNSKIDNAMDSISRKTEGKIPKGLAEIGGRMATNQIIIGARAANDTIATTIRTADNSIRTENRTAVVTAKTIEMPHRTAGDSKSDE